MGPVLEKIPFERTKMSFENFCKITTIHGFLEVYLAKNWLWKIIWVGITLGAIGLSAHQSFTIVEEYLERPTITKISMFEEDHKPYYPPLKICYMHWLFWLDYSKAQQVGLNKTTLLTALSFLKHGYSENEFNVDDAKSDLFKILRNKTLTNIHDFVAAISADHPPGFHLSTVHRVNFTKSLFSTGQRQYADLCYILKSTDILKIFANTKNVLVLLYNTSDRIAYSGGILTNNEYRINSAMDVKASLAADILVDPKLLPDKLYFPPFFSFDGQPAFQSANSFSHNAYRYKIKIAGRVYKWLNLIKNPCRSLVLQADDYENCALSCFLQAINQTAIPKTSECLTALELVLNKEATLDQACPFDMFFNDSHALKYQPQPKYLDLVQMTTEFETNLVTCKKSLCNRACEEWAFEGTVSQMATEFSLQDLGVPTTIELHYPRANNIVVHEEQVSQTWVSFIGNIGGVLGLWLGASVLSFLQAIYLCCNCNRID